MERLLGQSRLLTLTGPGGREVPAGPPGRRRAAHPVPGRLLLRRPLPGDRPGAGPGRGGQRAGGPEAAGRPILDGVKEHLRHRELLQVVDNFEQVAAAGPVIEELLTAAPKLRTMVTPGRCRSAASRSTVPAARALTRSVLTGLAARGVEAVRLFTERARPPNPGSP